VEVDGFPVFFAVDVDLVAGPPSRAVKPTRSPVEISNASIAAAGSLRSSPRR